MLIIPIHIVDNMFNKDIISRGKKLKIYPLINGFTML